MLDAFLAITDGLISRTDAIKKVSSDLRKMALNRGLEIDQIVRNENGIKLQIYGMKSAFYEQGQSIYSSKLFDDAVRIYREDQDEYQKLLNEAKLGVV